MRQDRRGTYFAFQGLFTAVLLLLFLYLGRPADDWVPRFVFLLAVSGAMLAFLRLARLQTLDHWPVQAAFFVTDAVLASLTLHWTDSHSELYLVYFLIIFGTALTRSLAQSFIVAMVTSLLYLVSAWSPASGFPKETAFWLRVNFLWVSSALLAILSRDSQLARGEEEDKYRQRLIQIERLATLGQAAGEVAHRIKGPLTTILVNAEVLTHRFAKSKETVKELAEIQEEVGRCKDILKNLLDLGRIEEMDVERLDLREPLRFALKSVEARLKRQGIACEVSGVDKPLPVEGDQSLLQEAVCAVLQNAADAMPKGGRLRVRVEPTGRLWGGTSHSRQLLLTVEDDGKGIQAADLERIFQPFFTTKGSDGTGLGLSAALHILQKHHGSIEAYSEGPGKGARFTLAVPRARGTA